MGMGRVHTESVKREGRGRACAHMRALGGW